MTRFDIYCSLRVPYLFEGALCTVCFVGCRSRTGVMRTMERASGQC